MRSIEELVKDGTLVCPKNREALRLEERSLRSKDGQRYPLAPSGAPLFLSSAIQKSYLSENNASMEKTYRPPSRSWVQKAFDSLLRWINAETHRSADSLQAWQHVAKQEAQAVYVSVGGGPQRHDPKFLNLNISNFDNVDIVGDAYELPFRDNSIDAIHCVAVLEHLENPKRAVEEFHRVLKKGAKAYLETPFLQPFHGYPNHFQNFTREGHNRLFESCGFKVLQSGVACGPAYALFHISITCISIAFPNKYLRIPLMALVALLIKPWDRWLLKKSDAHLGASTVYALLEKF